MIGVRAGRIDLDVLNEAGLGDMMTEYAFRRRRPADIAHTDKKDPELLYFHRIVLPRRPLAAYQIGPPISPGEAFYTYIQPAA